MRLDQDHVPAAPNSTARDGRPALSDRVRALRIADAPAGKRGSRGSFLPWAGCAILLLTTLVFGFKAFRAPPVAEDDTLKPAGPATVKSVSDTPVAAHPAGEVLLEAKGYVIAAHQIQL
ncbi:MAG TPA: hypothetical protein VFW33_03035, partial [Gemmataceae bacterium]|nr:hypothetical protein [Gemmataceae bacterium]